jgi:hypothetical protein
MTVQLRDSIGKTGRDPRIAWLTWAAVRRSLVAAVAIGAFLSVTGAYGSWRAPFLDRSVTMVVLSIAATLLGIAAMAAASLMGRVASHWWLHGAVGAILMTPPMALLVWTVERFTSHDPPPLAALPAFAPTTLASSLFFCGWAAWSGHRRRAGAMAVPPPREPAPVKFLDRLPPKLRDAELWAVEAEDHYLRLHTSKGQDLLLLRLSDAIGELDGLEGAQTHRSWWVARAAIADVHRGDGRAVLTLKNGVEAPVSRAHARRLRDRGWL